MKKGFIAFVKALLGVAKVVLAILGVLVLAVVASLLLSIPGGKRFSRYCSYPDMKALMDAERDDIVATVAYERGGTKMKDFAEYMSQATKDFDDPAVPLEKRGIRFVCKESVAAKTGPEKQKPDAPLTPCPGVVATATAWDALTNVCESVGCKFEVYHGKVEIGE